MSVQPVYFVHISDSHFGPTKDHELYGNVSYRNAERIVEAINELYTQPDFVIHTGDVVSNPDAAAYVLAAEVFAKLKAPIYYVTGNHDASAEIRRSLPMGECTFSSNAPGVLSYSFERKGYRFITLDARGPDEIDPHGVLSAHQFDFLDDEIRKDNKPLVLFIHFPPLEVNSKWFDEKMLLLNGDLLHRMLMPVRDRLCGVFYGHVHRGMVTFKDGILYSSVASTGGQFFAWPSDQFTSFDLDHPPCFNFVTLISGQTIIKEQSIPK